MVHFKAFGFPSVQTVTVTAQSDFSKAKYRMMEALLDAQDSVLS